MRILNITYIFYVDVGDAYMRFPVSYSDKITYASTHTNTRVLTFWLYISLGRVALTALVCFHVI